MTLWLAIIIIVGLVAMDAWGQGLDRKGGPFDPALFVTYAWVLIISVLGGLASFHQKVKAGESRWLNLSELIGELVTSAVAGLGGFWLCKWGGVDEWITAAIVGISGHMGSRGLFLAEKSLERWAQRFTGKDEKKQ